MLTNLDLYLHHTALETRHAVETLRIVVLESVMLVMETPAAATLLIVLVDVLKHSSLSDSHFILWYGSCLRQAVGVDRAIYL